MFRHLLTSATVAICAMQGHATPYCSELLDENTKVDSSLQRFIPLFTDEATGWIISPKYLSLNLTPTTEAAFVASEITKQFAKRGTKLAMILPPPRTLFMPAGVIQQFGEEGQAFSFEETRMAYQATVKAWQNAGAIAPDLSVLLDHVDKDQMYRRADLHWSATATSVVAQTIAEEISGEDYETPDFKATAKPNIKINDLLNAVCGKVAPPEDYKYFEPKLEYDLFADQAITVAYTGTSFSSSKFLSLPGKIEHFLKKPYADFSGNGFGHAGGMLMLLNSAELENTTYDTVIWEYPYLNSINDIGEMRQVLGKLEVGSELDFEELSSFEFDGGWVDVALPKALGAYQVLKFVAPSDKVERLYLSYKIDGKRKRHSLVRSKRLQGEARPDGFYFSLTGLDTDAITDLRVSFPKKNKGADVFIEATQK